MKLLTNSHVISLVLKFFPLPFDFLLSGLFVNLSLKRVFHFLGLEFFLVEEDLLLITSSEDSALFFKFHISAVFCDSATYFKIREVVFRLHWTVLGFGKVYSVWNRVLDLAVHRFVRSQLLLCVLRKQVRDFGFRNESYVLRTALLFLLVG